MQRRSSRTPTPRRDEDSHSLRGRGSRAQQRNLFSEKTKRRVPVAWILLILLLVAGLLAAYSLVDSSMARVEQVTITIPGLERAYEGFTILHISDLHGTRFGQEQSQLLSALSKQSYNVVCMTGDMVGSDGDAYAFYELIDGLSLSGKPILFIAGDEDPLAVYSEPHGSAEVLAEFILGAQRRGATYVDAPVSVSYGGRNVWFAPEMMYGLDVDASRARYQAQLDADLNGGNAELESVKARIRSLRYRIDTMVRAQDARENIQDRDLRIALTHVPLVSSLAGVGSGGTNGQPFATSMELILAGHYNGGQVRLPGYGALYIPNSNLARGGLFPDQNYVQGTMQVGGILQHVSPGLGVAKVFPLPFRLFNSPRITIIRLTGSLSS